MVGDLTAIHISVKKKKLESKCVLRTRYLVFLSLESVNNTCLGKDSP